MGHAAAHRQAKLSDARLSIKPTAIKLQLGCSLYHKLNYTSQYYLGLL